MTKWHAKLPQKKESCSVFFLERYGNFYVLNPINCENMRGPARVLPGQELRAELVPRERMAKSSSRSAMSAVCQNVVKILATFGSFSAVSAPTFASKNAFRNIFWDLQCYLIVSEISRFCNILQMILFAKIANFLLTFVTFHQKRWILIRFC